MNDVHKSKFVRIVKVEKCVERSLTKSKRDMGNLKPVEEKVKS